MVSFGLTTIHCPAYLHHDEVLNRKLGGELEGIRVVIQALDNHAKPSPIDEAIEVMNWQADHEQTRTTAELPRKASPISLLCHTHQPIDTIRGEKRETASIRSRDQQQTSSIRAKNGRRRASDSYQWEATKQRGSEAARQQATGNRQRG